VKSTKTIFGWRLLSFFLNLDIIGEALHKCKQSIRSKNKELVHTGMTGKIEEQVKSNEKF
jgi:uncharacterized protein with HEPN domain